MEGVFKMFNYSNKGINWLCLFLQFHNISKRLKNSACKEEYNNVSESALQFIIQEKHYGKTF